MFRCRPTSTSLGEIIHIAHSFVGKVLSSCAITPPIDGSFFDQIDVIAAISKIERRLHSCNPPANDHYGTNGSIFLGLHESTPLKFLMISRNNGKNAPKANECFSVENLVGIGAMPNLSRN